MNIFDTIIKDTEIIGISIYNDCEELQGTVRYSFKVLTKSSSVIIVGPRLKDGSDEHNKWLAEYVQIRHRIMDQVGEIAANAIRLPYIDQVGDAYEKLKDQLIDIFSDLVPAPHCQKDINPRITELYKSLSGLRDLVCLKTF